MNKPASMSEQMPETADWVNRMRIKYGRTHVDECLRRGLRGEAGYFFAMERGYVLGTPWEPGAAIDGAPLPVAKGKGMPVAVAQAMAVLYGASFAGFIREPAGAVAPAAGA